jgi:hypothetical protein
VHVCDITSEHWEPNSGASGQEYDANLASAVGLKWDRWRASASSYDMAPSTVLDGA